MDCEYSTTPAEINLTSLKSLFIKICSAVDAAPTPQILRERLIDFLVHENVSFHCVFDGRPQRPELAKKDLSYIQFK
jgi:hypothetical protein